MISPSDLNLFAACPWRLAHLVDEKLGKIEPPPEFIDPMMALVSQLGLAHEERQLRKLREDIEVVELDYSSADPANAESWRRNIQKAHLATLDSLKKSGVAVFQATLFEKVLPDAPLNIGFQGFADFIVPRESRWEIWDAKLARRAKSGALTQLAAYADHLRRLGVPLAPTVRLILGDDTQSVHRIDEISESLISQRQAVMKVIQERMISEAPLSWMDNRYPPCGTKSCPACQEQIIAQDDLFQIAGIRKSQRQKIIESGIGTLKKFSMASDLDLSKNQSGIKPEKLVDLSRQARLQVRSRENPGEPPAWEIVSRQIIRGLPAADPADLFLDFEGDPTYQEAGSVEFESALAFDANESLSFGIEYLIGLWGRELDGGGPTASYLTFWSDNLIQEKLAFKQFLNLITQRSKKNPGMRIYHFAPYERVRIRAMAARYKMDLGMVEKLMEHYFVDLYPVVRKGFAIGTPSYGLKALESLYMDPETRSGITGGDESVVAFRDYCIAIENSDHNAAEKIRAAILAYNRIDCISTNLLRDWILKSIPES